MRPPTRAMPGPSSSGSPPAFRRRTGPASPTRRRPSTGTSPPTRRLERLDPTTSRSSGPKATARVRLPRRMSGQPRRIGGLDGLVPVLGGVRLRPAAGPRAAPGKSRGLNGIRRPRRAVLPRSARRECVESGGVDSVLRIWMKTLSRLAAVSALVVGGLAWRDLAPRRPPPRNPPPRRSPRRPSPAAASGAWRRRSRSSRACIGRSRATPAARSRTRRTSRCPRARTGHFESVRGHVRSAEGLVRQAALDIYWRQHRPPDAVRPVLRQRRPVPHGDLRARRCAAQRRPRPRRRRSQQSAEGEGRHAASCRPRPSIRRRTTTRTTRRRIRFATASIAKAAAATSSSSRSGASSRPRETRRDHDRQRPRLDRAARSPVAPTPVPPPRGRGTRRRSSSRRTRSCRRS